MSEHAEFINELAKDIAEGARAGQWQGAEADLSVLAEQIVTALLEGRDEDVRRAYESVEETYSVLVTKIGRDQGPRSVVSELQAFTRLLGVALQHKQAPDRQHLSQVDAYRTVLDALLGKPEGLSGRELADQLKTTPETVARKLPVLRAAGLVVSRKVGRATINRLSEEATALLNIARRKAEWQQRTFRSAPKVIRQNPETAVPADVVAAEKAA